MADTEVGTANEAESARSESAEPSTTATGVAKKNTTAWLCSGIGLAVAIVLAAAALLDWGPLAGKGVIAFAGWVVAAVLHGALAALAINLFHPERPQNPTRVMGTLSRHNDRRNAAERVAATPREALHRRPSGQPSSGTA
jgi:hypothetical protein